MAANPLAHYLTRRRISQGEFGRTVGAGRGVVSRWCNGKRIPDRYFALVIERETKGAVPASAWPDVPIRRRARRSSQNPPHRSE